MKAVQHDIDIIIIKVEKGVAKAFGRFNQGGEMKVL